MSDMQAAHLTDKSLQTAYSHLKNHLGVDVSEGKHIPRVGYDCTLYVEFSRAIYHVSEAEFLT